MLGFLLANVVMPLAVSILYSKNTKRFTLQYDVIKGAYYLIYAIAIAYDYLISGQSRAVAGFALIVAILEGVPLILTKLFDNK